MRTYNAYQSAYYKAIFRPVTRPKVSVWQLCYGKIILQESEHYAILVNAKKSYLMQGRDYPNKNLLAIKPKTT